MNTSAKFGLIAESREWLYRVAYPLAILSPCNSLHVITHPEIIPDGDTPCLCGNDGCFVSRVLKGSDNAR